MVIKFHLHSYQYQYNLIFAQDFSVDLQGHHAKSIPCAALIKIHAIEGFLVSNSIGSFLTCHAEDGPCYATFEDTNFHMI